MTNILPFPTSFHGAGLNERFGGVSARADGAASDGFAGNGTEEYGDQILCRCDVACP